MAKGAGDLGAVLDEEAGNAQEGHGPEGRHPQPQPPGDGARPPRHLPPLPVHARIKDAPSAAPTDPASREAATTSGRQAFKTDVRIYGAPVGCLWLP